MSFISVVLCSHNPRQVYLERTLAGLRAQTLDQSEWEFLLVDNKSDSPLADRWALDWHRNGRHIREEQLGQTHARSRGIAESRGDLLVLVDDDNVLAPDYLDKARTIARSYPTLEAFGAGVLDPEFETPPAEEVRPWLPWLALRTVQEVQTSNDWGKRRCVPWGAGLCVTRRVAMLFAERAEMIHTAGLGRRGQSLLTGEDELFSFIACEQGSSFGIFPDLRITHLIPSERLSKEYLIRLIGGYSYSHTILGYLTSGKYPSERFWRTAVRTPFHGLRRGLFSMRCNTAALQGRKRAAAYIREERLRPILAKPEPLEAHHP